MRKVEVGIPSCKIASGIHLPLNSLLHVVSMHIVITLTRAAQHSLVFFKTDVTSQNHCRLEYYLLW